ncbi:signal peptidase II [Nocardioides daejeonensis]|uniref:signal peptidase II n=1 Tax=Nocardioides daejeonensis TaxID=1046556 RepID=UPI001EF4E264|nr:signal peptidase II [Nocardioides daejeonensis]
MWKTRGEMEAARGASRGAGDRRPGPDETDPESPVASPRSRGVSRLLFWAAALVMVGIDQWSKHAALTHLTPYETRPLLGDLLGLRLVRNPGAAFSMGTSATEILAGFACLAAIVVIVLSFRVADRFWAIGLGFLLAGICGNLIDRLTREPGFFRGHVVDMFALPNFPVFNVADVCINIAAGVIIIQALRGIRLDGSRDEADKRTDDD